MHIWSQLLRVRGILTTFNQYTSKQSLGTRRVLPHANSVAGVSLSRFKAHHNLRRTVERACTQLVRSGAASKPLSCGRKCFTIQLVARWGLLVRGLSLKSWDSSFVPRLVITLAEQPYRKICLSANPSTVAFDFMFATKYPLLKGWISQQWKGDT